MKTTSSTTRSALIASVYESCYDNLLHYITGYTRDVMAAEDMLQDLFVRIMSLDVITEATVRNLVFVMAKRMIVDDARHKAFVRRQEKDLAQTLSLYDDHSVARRVECDEIAAIESRILSHMSPKRAQVYAMSRHEDLTAQEIADKLSLSKRTVEAHLYQSKKIMRQKIAAVI